MNSTAQSEPINISTEQKIEIVKTLKAYPLVLKELQITEDLLTTCNDIREQDKQLLITKDLQISNLDSQIRNLKNQNKIYQNKIKTNFLKGTALGAFIVLILSLL